MIFLTVGTQFPFDRLVKQVDEMAGRDCFDEPVFAQIGEALYRPRNFEWTSSLEKASFETYIKDASCVIGHAGMGTIMTALENERPILVMPRMSRYGEAVNDHQLAIARKFDRLGYLLAAYDERELPEKFVKLCSVRLRRRKGRAEAVAARIARFLGELPFAERCPY